MHGSSNWRFRQLPRMDFTLIKLTLIKDLPATYNNGGSGGDPSNGFGFGSGDGDGCGWDDGSGDGSGFGSGFGYDNGNGGGDG